MRTTVTAIWRPLAEFLQTEIAGGVLLLAATVVALIWANTPLGASYEPLWQTRLPLLVGGIHLDLTARQWLNDGLMALFFFVVGLEIKRQVVDGELRDLKSAALPFMGALGGMVVPAALYLAFNLGSISARGWAIPMATDIAFAVGVLALFGSRIPLGLKIFLLSLAIVDDIGAIMVIAVFYSSAIALIPMLLGLMAIALFAVSWRWSARWLIPVRIALAAVAWFAVHESGVHATIAGVALGLVVPAGPNPNPSPAERLEHSFHPYTSFLIVPLFALANAGVRLAPESLAAALTSPIGLGIVAGLVVGKTVGISAAAYLACRLRIARLPIGVTWFQIVGAAAVAGIGFTVSLFIARLSFSTDLELTHARSAVLTGSLIAASLGYLLLHFATRNSTGSQKSSVAETAP